MIDFLVNVDRRDAQSVFGRAAKRGSVYRWGMAPGRSAWLGQPGPTERSADAEHEFEGPLADSGHRVWLAITRLASDRRLPKKLRRTVDLSAAAERAAHGLMTIDQLTASAATQAIVWAAALPNLERELTPLTCEAVLTAIHQFRDGALTTAAAASPLQLMLGGELALTLAWRGVRGAASELLVSSAIDSLRRWSEDADRAVSAALESPAEVRLILASLLRCQALINATTEASFPTASARTGRELATWAAALTTSGGATAFADATGSPRVNAVGLDESGGPDESLGPDKSERSSALWGPGGLFTAAARFDPDSLTPAFAAALGRKPAGGRLAWQVSLPAAIHHCSDAKLAVMFPDWDVRRGRTHVDYSGDQVRIEIYAGRRRVLAGDWQTEIETEHGPQHARGPWEEICTHSDDDVHYLELEQAWSGGMVLQRQWLLIRDDRTLLLTDSVLSGSAGERVAESIRYVSRLPLDLGIEVAEEPETREVFLQDGQHRALVLPLSASEWKVGPTAASLQASTAGPGTARQPARSARRSSLEFSASGSRRLYAPLWFDFQRRRFRRKRTWRQLTVADQLRLVSPDEAVGYRVQVGSEQWMVYRSLADHVCRSVLGKHVITDFFASRFDPEDGGHEELLSVDNDDEYES